jgi:hypothetical protein
MIAADAAQEHQGVLLSIAGWKRGGVGPRLSEPAQNFPVPIGTWIAGTSLDLNWPLLRRSKGRSPSSVMRCANRDRALTRFFRWRLVRVYCSRSVSRTRHFQLRFQNDTSPAMRPPDSQTNVPPTGNGRSQDLLGCLKRSDRSNLSKTF